MGEYKGPGGGHGGPPFIYRGKKNRRERQKGRISNKKPLKANIKVEKYLF